MYNRVCVLVLKSKRDERRIHLLISLINELKMEKGEEVIDLDVFDKSMGYDEEGLKEKLATDYFDLDLGDVCGTPGPSEP